MKSLLSAACDNALSGLAHRFTDWHVARCPRCMAALAALRALHSRLQTLVSSRPETAAHLPPERWMRLEAAWAEADGRT